MSHLNFAIIENSLKFASCKISKNFQKGKQLDDNI